MYMASMGPRSRERGNLTIALGVTGATSASMGPRSRERGNALKAGELTREQALLQWGRAHVSAETGTVLRAYVEHAPASMGPRSRERGNPGSCPSQGKRVVASMGPRSRERGNPVLLNGRGWRGVASMGPRSRERGNRMSRLVPGRLRPGFNGAALT